MPDIEVNIEIFCARCGAGICNNASTIRHRNQDAFSIEPCEKCLEESYNDGYKKGEEEATK